jgi:hypothetical protein
VNKLTVTALTAVGLSLALSSAVSAGKIHTGGARGAYNGDFCPQLSSELAKAKFDFKCTPSLGSNANLASVKDNPQDIGFSQFDVYTLTASQQAVPAYEIIRSDMARECLFMVTKNKNLSNYGDVVANAEKLKFILPPEGTGSASTFNYLRQIDPEGLGKATDISYAATTDSALKSTLADADENTVTLFVQFPDPSNDRFKMINKDNGFFVPVIDRNILRQQVGNDKIYFAQETEVSNPKLWKQGESVVTACTPMVVFTGNPELLPAGDEQLDHKDLISTARAIPSNALRPQQGFFKKYWKKTKALSATAVDSMLDASEKAREKATPMYESAKEKAKELGQKLRKKPKSLAKRQPLSLKMPKKKPKSSARRPSIRRKNLATRLKNKPLNKSARI